MRTGEPSPRPATARIALAAAGITCALVLLAQEATLLAWRACGRTDPHPGEWVAVIALVCGPPLAWATGLAVRVGRALPNALDTRARDGAARLHRLAVAFVILSTALALVQTARVSAFMVDPKLTRDCADAKSGVHMCMPAYVRAGELSRDHAANLYEAGKYKSPKGAPPLHTAVAHLQEYLADPFEYPPPFIALPRAALALTNDFLVLRTTWFVLQALILGWFGLALARWIGGTNARAGLVTMLLLPALWASIPFSRNLELGQVHLLSIAMALAGMVAFEQRRDFLGGSLLGAAVAVKIAPGLLLVGALSRGRGRDRVRPIVFTAAFVVAYALAGLVLLGPAPYVAFVTYQLPRIASGEAFASFASNPVNIAVYSLPLKLRALGVVGLPDNAPSTLSWIYGLALVPLAIASARRSANTRIDSAQRWLAILNLAALRSPYTGFPYANAGTVWLLTLLASTAKSTRALWALAGAWVFFAGLLFVPFPEPLLSFVRIAGQLAVLALNVWSALRLRYVPAQIEKSALERAATQTAER